MPDIGRPGLPGDDIQARPIRVQVVQVMVGHFRPGWTERKKCLLPPGGAQQVAGHGLGAAHQQPWRPLSQKYFQSPGFIAIAHGRGGGMGVDVINVRR